MIARRGRVSLPDKRIEGKSERPTMESNPGSRAGDEGWDPGNRFESSLAELQKHSKAREDSANRRIARRTLEGLFIGFLEPGLALFQTQKRYGEAVLYFGLATEMNPDRPGAFF